MATKKLDSISSLKNKGSYSSLSGKFYVLAKEQIVYKYTLGEIKSNYSRSAVTVKLLLPVGTVVYLTSGKCRASQAKVLQMNKLGRSETVDISYASYNDYFKYIVGATVKPANKFNLEYKMCESGIHFFRTLTEARQYAARR
jgi:hypothetical protein